MDSGKADVSKLTGYHDNQYVVDDDITSGQYSGPIVVFDQNALIEGPTALPVEHNFDPSQDWVLHIEFMLHGLTTGSNGQEVFAIVRNDVPGIALIAKGQDMIFYYGDASNGGISNILFCSGLDVRKDIYIDLMYQVEGHRLVGGINNRKTLDTTVSLINNNANIVGLNGLVQNFAPYPIHYYIVYLVQNT